MALHQTIRYSKLLQIILSVFIIHVATSTARADIVEATAERYLLRHEAVSTLTPDALWDKLIKPETWWHPDHTYSGNAENLSLDLQAGGMWREDWDGGSVVHGTVLTSLHGKMLRLNAPFGPLQGLDVTVIWTITIMPDGEGSKVIFDEIAGGTAGSKLDALAPAVDFVKAEAIRRLTTAE